MIDVKWLFFDIGYTLVNEDASHEARINDTIKTQKEKHKNFTYNEIYQEMVQASLEYKQPYATALKTLETDDFEPYPKELEFPYYNAQSVLEKLHMFYKIGIIANQSAGTVKRLTSYGLIDYIDLCFSSAEEGLSKPDIEFYRRALETADCCAEQAVMIGDRLDNDIFPAKTLGMKTVWIKQGFGGMQEPKSKEYEPDYIVYNLDELVKLFVK